MIEFVPFSKIPRLNRAVCITEKIDGTNACVHVDEDGTVTAGSRTRWITPADDNHGFAKWVAAHEDELRTGLGIGRHFGEWWGQGIQRKYGLTEKRFSLFNVAKWGETRPACCHVVPTLADNATLADVPMVLAALRVSGSHAAPGFMKPEGIVIYHTAAGHLYKVTLEGDEKPKGQP
jgi:hypothetical protein